MEIESILGIKIFHAELYQQYLSTPSSPPFELLQKVAKISEI